MNWLLYIPGQPVGSLSMKPPTNSDETSSISDGSSFSWTRWNIDELLLPQHLAILLVEGMPVKQLFTYAMLLEPVAHKPGEYRAVSEGPFILLKGSFKPYSVPPRLTDIVLARLYGSTLPHQEVLGALVQAVLAP